jgi:hypothetical protein
MLPGGFDGEVAQKWGAAGAPNAVFELAADSLQTMTGGQIVQVK